MKAALAVLVGLLAVVVIYVFCFVLPVEERTVNDRKPDPPKQQPAQATVKEVAATTSHDPARRHR